MKNKVACSHQPAAVSENVDDPHQTAALCDVRTGADGPANVSCTACFCVSRGEDSRSRRDLSSSRTDSRRRLALWKRICEHCAYGVGVSWEEDESFTGLGFKRVE